MLRPLAPWVLVVVVGSVACGPGEVEVPAPPQPESLTGFDPGVIVRIREALAKVGAEPQKAQAWAELGYVYTSERLKGLALDCFRVAARLEPRQPKWPYREAVTLAQIGSFEEASAAMERSLALEPGYPPSHARLGNYRLALGDLGRAEEAFRSATVLDSSYPGGWIGLARVALQRDQNTEAAAILRRLVAQDPEDRTFRQLLALAEPGAADAADGAPLAEENIPVWNDPWELEARAFRRKPSMLEVGRLLKEGQAAEALALLEDERARGADPFDTALSFAAAYQQLGRTSELERELATVLAREPENTTALLMKVQLIEDQGDVKSALRLIDRVTALQPTFAGAFAAKGHMLARNHYHDDAVLAFQSALELGLRDFELRSQLAGSLIATKQWPAALALTEELVRERPEHGDSWLRLAIVRRKNGQLEEASAAIERARATTNATPALLEDVQKAQAASLARAAGKGAGEAEEEPK